MERVFATFGALSRENILEIVPSGAMFDHMEAMLVRKCYHSWTLSFLISAPDQPRNPDVQVPISRRHA